MTLGAVITIYLSLLLVGVFLVTGVIVNSVVQVRRGQGHHPDLPQGRRADGGRQRAAAVAARRDHAGRGRRLHHQGPGAREVQAGHDAEPRDHRAARGQPAAGVARRHAQGPARPSSRWSAKIKANPLFLKVADRPDNPEESLKYGQQIVKKLFAFTRVCAWHRDRVRHHARHRLAHLHQQHDPSRHLRAPQGDRHHAPRRREQLVHPDAVPARGRAAGA